MPISHVTEPSSDQYRDTIADGTDIYGNAVTVIAGFGLKARPVESASLDPCVAWESLVAR
jgi:hypothetical protein